MSEETPRPPRRKRYSGKNPRRFEDKYKEHNPDRYADTVAKVIASGKTPAGSHLPIMVEECLQALQLAPGQMGIDCTLGYGGHALRILEHISPSGKLLGLDQDPIELPRTAQRILAAGYDHSSFEPIRSNYAGITKVLQQRELEGVDFIFADLGCSSMQFDDPTRGFSFKNSGPLDMRMNPARGLSARDWLARISAEKLAIALHEHSDEPRAESLAEALAGKNIATTTEFAALDTFLRALPPALNLGGRVAILTFHSGEDRRVKKAFQAAQREGLLSVISDSVITATPEERRLNPRSSPAKLRWATR
jgi:16S rRNA (cytosine1402-N4)-methyltransferase